MQEEIESAGAAGKSWGEQVLAIGKYSGVSGRGCSEYHLPGCDNDRGITAEC